ncbi:uncharacterized protein RB166_021519 [Leptodactylus fuscus]
MECRLPNDKLSGLRADVQRACRLKKLRLRELQSLLGKLNFACRIMPMGRVFSQRLASASAGVTVPSHFVRLGSELRGDLGVWESFLMQYNGRSLWMGDVVEAADFELFTDAAGSVGFGAYFGGSWCVGSWPDVWVSSGLVKNLALLELFPILVSVIVWGEFFRNNRVRFHCDNLGVVQALNRLSASSPPVVRVLQRLVLECLRLNACVVAVHVPGVPTVGAIQDSGAGSGGIRVAMADGVVGRAGRSAESLIRASLVENTWLAYGKAWDEWGRWLALLGAGAEDVEMALVLFVGHCKEAGWSVCKMNSGLAGLAFGFKSRGLKDFTKSFFGAKSGKRVASFTGVGG